MTIFDGKYCLNTKKALYATYRAWMVAGEGFEPTTQGL